MKSFDKVKAEKIHLTLTLAEVDALVHLGRYAMANKKIPLLSGEATLESALQKLDEAVNL